MMSRFELDGGRPEPDGHRRRPPLSEPRVPPVEQQPFHDHREVRAKRALTGEERERRVVLLEQPQVHVLREILGFVRRQPAVAGDGRDHVAEEREIG
ncbi:MAG: hypothetical protein QM736_26335 [Vicinamibacterales bacterium]